VWIVIEIDNSRVTGQLRPRSGLWEVARAMRLFKCRTEHATWISDHSTFSFLAAVRSFKNCRNEGNYCEIPS
jgi:hypothetical protein